MTMGSRSDPVRDRLARQMLDGVRRLRSYAAAHAADMPLYVDPQGAYDDCVFRKPGARAEST
jgi:hypothetical protein